MEALVALMHSQRQELSDLDADVLDALSAIWLHQARTPQDDAVAELNDFLHLRGLVPKEGGHGRRGGFRSHQREAMLRALWHIQNLWLTVSLMPHGKSAHVARPEVIQSRAFVITDRMGLLQLDGTVSVRSFVFRPGKVFARYLFGPGRQTALLAARALQYHPSKQRQEKRLARYLSWLWSVQALCGERAGRQSVADVLDAIGHEGVPRYPAKVRDRLEKALDTLREDGIIASWRYERRSEGRAPGHRWFETWRMATVHIEPPESVRRYHRSVVVSPDDFGAGSARAGGEGGAGAGGSLGEQLRARRKALKLTQRQAADEVGISQAHWGRVERGKAREGSLGAPLRHALEQWLAGE